MRSKYVIGSLTFSAKDKIRRYFGLIRNKYYTGQTIEDPDDLQAVSALLQGHVDRGQKLGPGIKRYFVDDAPDHPNATCFWVERVDGTSTDFGVAACIAQIGTLNRQSLRECIKPQIAAYRKSRIPVGNPCFTSDFSGDVFPISELHIDHKDTTFEEIVRQFAELESINIDTELLTLSVDACSGPRWRDPGIAERFYSFHQTFSLQMLSRVENLSVKKIADSVRFKIKTMECTTPSQ